MRLARTVFVGLTAVLVASVVALAALDPGRPLDPLRLPALPAEGVAVQGEEGLVLVSLRGRVIGHVRGFQLAYAPYQLPDLVTVEDGSRRSWLLDTGLGRFRLSGGRIPLAGGAEFDQSGPSRRVVRDGKTLWSFPKSDFWFISQGRDLVTDVGARRSVVFDVTTRAVRSLPRGCKAAGRRGTELILICAPASSPLRPRTIEALQPSGSRVVLTGAPPGSVNRAGFWVWAYVSPDSKTIAAEWSGDCEEGTAFFIGGGKVRPVLGDAAMPQSHVLGWSKEGSAIVFVPQGGCGAKARPGVYRIEPCGRRTLVVATGESETGAALWVPV